MNTIYNTAACIQEAVSPRHPLYGHIPGLPEKFGRDFALEMFRRANFARHFELQVKEAADRKLFEIPIYLSLGTEFNSAALSLVLPGIHIFGQHRCHSLCLNFGGSPEQLRDELLGLPTGNSGGMAGSNAMQSPEIRMYGHSGLMGEQVPIAVGAALASAEPCLAICGDASVEEDYIYPSLGYAATRRLPVLFVCEDNDLSILTRVSVRRSWNPADVARSLGMASVDIADDPWLIAHHAREMARSLPGFINIRCVRVLWHAGTGKDGEPEWDRYALVCAEMERLGLGEEMARMDQENRLRAAHIWEKQSPKR